MKREESECFPTDMVLLALRGNNTKFGKMFPKCLDIKYSAMWTKS